MNASDTANVSATNDVSPPTILSAEIGPYPTNLMDPVKPIVKATFSDGQVRELFSFYPDEIGFIESDFIGKTEAQARVLRYQKDVAYLQEYNVRSKRMRP
jgi:hypothetical protein